MRARPLKRYRLLLTFAAQVIVLIFLCRAVSGADAFSPDILKYADQAVAATNIPLSPVRVAVEMIGEDESDAFRLLLARAAAASLP